MNNHTVGWRRTLRPVALLLAALLLVSAAWLPGSTASAAPATGHEKLLGDLPTLLGKAGDRSPVNVIIRFHEELDALDWAGLERHAGQKIAASHRFAAIQGIATKLPAPAIRALANSPKVAAVEHDAPVKASLANATHWFGTKAARQQFSLSGEGITIAVIDTGIDANHVDLAGRVIGWYDWVTGSATPIDDNGHGTHVASIAAGTGAASANHVGVAPGAKLVGLKALDSRGSGSTSTVIAAVQWTIDNRATYGIRVVNLSLGTSTSSDGKDSLSAIVDKAAASGILPVVSAGNSGPAAYTVGSPAAAARALTVGSMADPGNGGFFLAPYSSRGPTKDGRVKPDIVAPGYLISAAKANSTNGYVTMNGTSMASPFVAGVAALMLQANPNLTPDQVKSLIMATAHDWGQAGADFEYGAGRLDGFAAIAAAANASAANPIATPRSQSHSGKLSGTGDRQSYSLNITDRTFPLAATLIIPSWAGAGTPDFVVEFYDPAGKLIGSSLQDSRQDTLSRTPATTGTFRVDVVSKSGSGSYQIDLSAGWGEAPPPPPPSEPAPTEPTPAPTAWSSGDLEPSTWTATGTGSAQKDYSLTAPAHNPSGAKVTVRITDYRADGSGAVDGKPPYLELWTVVNGADGTLLGTLQPTKAGTYQVVVADPAALTAWNGSGTLRVKVHSLDRKTGKLADRVAIDLVAVDLTY